MLKRSYCFIILLPVILCLNAIECKGQLKPANEPWDRISTYFSPPEMYVGRYGKYKSPLIFSNGDSVKSNEEWKKRREEILDFWHQQMGKWPDLLKNQELEIIDTLYRENFVQYRVRFYWTPNERTEGYLLIPDGEEPKPAVITVYYEPETAIGNGIALRDFAYQLTKRGFITLSLGTKDASEAKRYSIYYPDVDHAEVEPLSMLAYAAANAWQVLSKVEGVDSTRIGIMGHSFGGKWAMFASCLYEKFACAVWSDPGIVFDESRGDINYWEPWYLGYHPPPWRERGIISNSNPARGLYPKLIDMGVDLTDLHALMAPRPFLVSGGSEDPPERWLAINHAIAVNQVLGYKNRVAMTNRPAHSPSATSNEQAYLFFEHFLRP